MDLDKIIKFREEQQAKQDEATALKNRQIEDDNRIKLLAKTTVSSNETLRKTIEKTNTKEDLAQLTDVVADLTVSSFVTQKKTIEQLNELNKAITELPKTFPDSPKFPEIPIPPEEITVKNLGEVTSWLEKVVKGISNIKFNPKIEVSTPKVVVPETVVNVPETKLDLTPITQGLIDVKKEFGKIKLETDFSKLEGAVKKTTDAINNLSFPVPNYVLPFSKDGKATQVTLNSDGSLPTSTTLTTTSYKTEVDKSTTTNVIYIGKAPIGTALGTGAWQIKKIDKTVTDNVTITFAAAGAFTATWNNRGSETYS